MARQTYVGFVDPSGGARDSFTLAVAHGVRGVAVLDGYWEERPPFNPDEVVRKFAEILKSYHIRQVVGDRYAGAWVPSRFREHGIVYVASEKTKSEIFLEFLALANSDRAAVPADKRLRVQLVALERHTSRSGHDAVDHPSGGHDDVANCVAGALVLASARRRTPREPIFEFVPFGGGRTSASDTTGFPQDGKSSLWKDVF
jgi:hypothetical protein